MKQLDAGAWNETLERKRREVELSMVTVRHIHWLYGIMAASLGLLMAQSAPASMVLAWVCGFLLYSALRWWLTAAYFADMRGPRRVSMETWLRGMAASAMGIGVVFGSMLLVVFPHADGQTQLFWNLVIALCGVMIAMNATPAQAFVYAGVALPFQVAAWGIWGGNLALPMMLAQLVLQAWLALIGVKQGRAQYERASLSLRNERLAHELAANNDMLQRANRSKSNLLAAASHDLRQPVHALGMLVELMENASHAERERLVRPVKASVDALADMLNELLDFNRLDLGLYRQSVKPVPLHVLAQELHDSYSITANLRGLEFALAGPALSVMSDAPLLRRVLSNLISNAIKFTQTGKMELEWGESDGAAYLEVRDTGIGIPAERLKHIFEEYVHFQPSGEPGEGLGLGLSIVQKACELLGHTVTVSSVPGVGSRFRLKLGHALPATASPQPAGKATVPRAGGHRFEGMTVAVIENDSLVLNSLLNTLATWGCRALGAPSGELMDDRLAQVGHPPDLVLSDLHLSRANDGLDVIARLRERYALPGLPAILVTGDLDPEIETRARAASVTLAHKPLRPSRLNALLAQAMGIKTTHA